LPHGPPYGGDQGRRRGLWRRTAPERGHRIRELVYDAFVSGDHATHFYVLSGPDFIVGPDTDPAQRNILGIVNKVGVRLGQRVLRHLSETHEVLSMLGGRFVHPVMGLPGGVAKAVTPEMQQRLIEIGESMVEFGQFGLGLWRDMPCSATTSSAT
jgi:F420-non-reducing hydrogenase large subunit